MKEGIHPKYEIISIKCACGNSFQTRSTLPALTLDICSKCHPFFTGKQKLVDSAGRVDKFLKKAAKKSEEKTTKKAKSIFVRKLSTKKQKIKILSTSTKRARTGATRNKKEKTDKPS